MTRGVSSEATGAIGPSYERATAAVYLAAMLSGTAGPGVRGPVTYVGAQQPSALDDLEIRFDAQAGQTGVMRLQLKHQLALTASRSNTDFAKIVADSWHVLDSVTFQDGLDRIGAAAERLSADAYYASQRLGEMAALASDGLSLVAALDAPGQGGDAKKVWNAVAALSAQTLGRTATNDELHRFWRHFTVLRIETVMRHHDDRIRAVDRLRSVTFAPGTPDPLALFGALERIAGTLNVRGAGVDAVQLRALLVETDAIYLEAVDPSLEGIARTARQAAADDAKRWRAHLGVRAVAPRFEPLDPVALNDDNSDASIRGEAFDLGDIDKYLRRHRGLGIYGQPGAGKSQSLVQIADALLETSELIPIVRSLPRMALSQGAMLDQITADDPWRDVARDGLILLARSGQLALLLDGWNELGPSQRDWAWHALDDLRRLYPDIKLAITTRSGTGSPYGAAMRLKLIEFDRDRQREAAALFYGPKGVELLGRARANTNLRPLLRIPLFLTAIVDQANGGRLPSDRETAIRNLVDVAKGSEQTREAMRRALDGRQDDLLEDLAWALMTRESTAIGEDDALVLLARSLKRLRHENRLYSPLTPPQALEQLLADAVLAASGEPGRRSIAFSHQLLQEWFASHRIDAALVEGTAITGTMLELVDKPFWATTILFSVEHLARSANPGMLGPLLLATLGIEPFLAAEMLARLPEAMAAALDPQLAAFADAWREEDAERATAFMLASGRSQFSEAIWQALAERGDFAFGLRQFRHAFPHSAIAPGWDAHFPALKGQVRRVLLIDIIDQGDAEGLDRVVAAARSDPDDDVVSGVIDYLDFHDEAASLNRLVAALDDAIGLQIARERRPDNLDAANLIRWGGWRQLRFAEAEGMEWVNLALEFGGASPRVIAEAAIAVKFDNDWPARDFYDRVVEKHGDAFGRALAEMLRKGERIPFAARAYLPREAEGGQDFLAIATSDTAGYEARSNAAKMLDRAAIDALIGDLFAVSGDVYFRRDDRIRRILGVLEQVTFDLLLAAVLDREASEPGQAQVLAILLGDWKSGTDRPHLPLAPGARIRLIPRLRSWTATILTDPDSPRSRLADLAELIGRIGERALLADLLALRETDIARQAAQRKALEAAHYRDAHSEARMDYSSHYREALVRIGGDVVTAAMVERFADADWEEDAAVVLGRLGAVDPRPRDPLLGRNPNDLAARRAGLAERGAHAPDPTAALILDRIDALVAGGDKASVGRALMLSGPVMQMDFGDRAPSLRALFHAASEQYRFIDFCKAFAERGERIPATVVRENIEKEAAIIAAQQWVAENDYWKLNAWIRLIAFADDPVAALPDFKSLPRHFTERNGLSDLVYSLGYTDAPTAAKALFALQAADPSLLFGTGWATALAELGTHEAADLLLDAIAAAPTDAKQWRDTYGIHRALATLLTQPAARARAFALLAQTSQRAKQALLASAIVETMNEADAIALLELTGAPERSVIGRELIGRLENAAVIRKPIEGSSNTYELEATPLIEFRKRAFAMLLADTAGSTIARQCLQAVDHLRDRYGKPSLEPNHPDLAKQRPWPSAAALVWGGGITQD